MRSDIAQQWPSLANGDCGECEPLLQHRLVVGALRFVRRGVSMGDGAL